MMDSRSTSPWSGPGADLHLELRGTRLRAGSHTGPGTGPRTGLRAGLTDALREAVRDGRLAPGTRLPSSRSLAADLGVARNTVVDAYAELVAEGWLTARQGSGTRVAAQAVTLAAPRTARTAHPARTADTGRTGPGTPRYSLVPGSPDLSSFPRTAWLRAARRALTDAPNEAFGYGDPRGRVELRTALAGYLARTRGVRCDPDRIVVCAGFAHGLTLLAGLLRARGADAVAVESHGLDLHRALLAERGLRLPPLPFDARGTVTGAGVTPPGTAAVLLTPAHQFPLGSPLHPDRRTAVVDWARSTGGLIVEDDYDGEFRYDRRPVGALQGLDPDRVVYCGTASKALAPGLRLGWLVLPARLVDEVLALKGGVRASDWALSTPDQLTLAGFIGSGAYDRQVRAMRQRYRRRRDELVAALAERAPGVGVRGIAAGLHAVLDLPPGTEDAVVRAAARRGLALEGLSGFRHPEVPATGDALVVGYGGPSDSAWPGTLDALCRVLPTDDR
ncbi:PLP-dependent aminotransferase family protein [Streptomyces sp. NPDC000594]|uniref:MocR-like pyridoxine biosynthesis transcription factor PdxR n=1 Tax=Streptomyces sp. NPDC000594 TaxID=3154261 RepID=UPI0033174AF4